MVGEELHQLLLIPVHQALQVLHAERAQVHQQLPHQRVADLATLVSAVDADRVHDGRRLRPSELAVVDARDHEADDVVVELRDEARVDRVRLERRGHLSLVVRAAVATGGLPVDPDDGVEVVRA